MLHLKNARLGFQVFLTKQPIKTYTESGQDDICGLIEKTTHAKVRLLGFNPDTTRRYPFDLGKCMLDVYIHQFLHLNSDDEKCSSLIRLLFPKIKHLKPLIMTCVISLVINTWIWLLSIQITLGHLEIPICQSPNLGGCCCLLRHWVPAGNSLYSKCLMCSVCCKRMKQSWSQEMPVHSSR